MKFNNSTVIILCAGMGTRLGIGTTKALVDICGKPLIIKMLECLNEFDDIRIVVGFQAEKLIKTVNEYRNDITYIFNREYETTGPAASMWKGLSNSNNNVIVIDGDLIIERNSFNNIIKEDECIAYSTISSDEPIYVNVNDGKVTHFSTKETKYIWPGIVKINKNKIEDGNCFVYETISNSLPLKAVEIKAMEIDTQDDYERALDWVKNNYN